MAAEIAGNVRSNAGIKTIMPGRKKSNLYRELMLPGEMIILTETGLFIEYPTAGKGPITGD